MNDSARDRAQALSDADTLLLSLGASLLRWRRRIVAFGLAGAVVGLAGGLLKAKVYRSTATFLPQGNEALAAGGSPGLAMVASQLGIRMPAGATWGPPVYASLLQSPVLLTTLVRDTLVVAEEGGRRATVADLLRITAQDPEERRERAVRALAHLVRVRELKPQNAVEVTVTTRWPSVSFALARQLVTEVQRFNVEVRKSQGAAERQFVEARVGEIALELREAEDRLQAFLQKNRSFVSPELEFQRDRLQRVVLLRQQVYTTLMQSLEEARIREVRDTPVITLLQEPRLPVLREPRGTILRIGLGGLAGGLLCLLLAFVADGLVAARRLPGSDAEEFFKQLDQAVPRFLRRKAI